MNWRGIATRASVAALLFYALTLRALPFSLTSMVIGFGGTHPSQFVARVMQVVGVLALVTGLLATIGTVLVWRRPRRSLGRGRLLTLHLGGIVHIVVHAAVALWLAMRLRSFESFGNAEELSDGIPWMWLVQPSQQAALTTLTAIDVIAWTVVMVTSASSWVLLSKRLRQRLWFAGDLLLLGTNLAISGIIPLIPQSRQAEEIYASTFRLALLVLLTLRLLIRLLPFGLRGLEHGGIATLIAARHLRARKSGFLAAIGALSILAVSFSSCALTTTLSVMGGFRDDLQNKILGNHAHVVIDSDRGLHGDWKSLLKQVRGTTDVEAATPFVGGEVMLTSASNLSGAVLRGIEPASIAAVTDLRKNMRRGSLSFLVDPSRLLRSTVDPEGSPPGPSSANVADSDPLASRQLLPGVIVGQELARSLRLTVGDDLNVVSPFGDLGPAGPMPKSKAFRVAGIFYSGMYEYDMKYAYVLLGEAQRFFRKGTSISGIEIKLRHFEQASLVAKELRRRTAAFADLRIRDWQELNKNLFGALALEKLAMFVTLGIAILVAGFCVFGTLTLMVQEKHREVAILNAMGSSRRHIMQIFLSEGLLIGMLGAAIGLGLGFVVCFAAQHFGIRMNPEVYYIDQLPVHIDLFEFGAVGLAAVAVCLLATLFPAYLASRTRPSEALRYE